MAIVKRNGSTEAYSEQKMKKFLTWATEGTPCPVEQLYEELTIPVKDTDVSDLLKDIVDVAEKLASRITPTWLLVAGRVYAVDLIKQHRANGLNLIAPSHRDIEDFLISQLHTFTGVGADIKGKWALLIHEAMDINYDYSLPINNMRMLCERQARKYKGINETPSLVLLRQAVAASEYEKGKYDPVHALFLFRASRGHIGSLSESNTGQALFTHATPMSIHAGKPTRSTGSCTLLTTADDSASIMDTASQLALHSKHGSGNGIDVSAIAASGRLISTTEGRSNGVKPFLRIYESVLRAFNQSGKREGAGVVTFRFWHADFLELVYLRNTIGESESRIRGLKYAMCTYQFLYDLAEKNEDAVLVCPNAARKYFGDDRLLTDIGTDFVESYSKIIEQVKLGVVEGRVVKARWIFKLYFENVYNHGNLYETNLDNINDQNMLSDNVYSSNLCTEVMIPSRYDTEIKTGLCFLNSTNIYTFSTLNQEDQLELVYNQVKALDNQIETDFYPVPHTSESYAKSSRFIGVGISNLATLFAKRKIHWDSQEALELMDKVMDDWSYAVISASVRLAKERGPAADYIKSKWREGFIPHEFSKPAAQRLTEYEPNIERWAKLCIEMEDYGVRNCLLMALAPTASSGAGAGLTEGQDPVEQVIFTRSGDIPVTHCVSMDTSVLPFYDRAFDIPNEAIIKLAAVRQKWLDQGQSVSLFAKGKSFSLKEAYSERKLANDLGIKTIYYTKFEKADADQCESCT